MDILPIALAPVSPETLTHNPRDVWPAWTDSDTWTADDATADRLAWVNDDANNELESYPGRGWDHVETSTPTLEEEAEERGFQTGLEMGRPCSPTTWPDSARMAYARGRQRGMKRRDEREDREEAEYEAWLDELARERDAELMLEDAWSWHEAERCAVIGSVEARKGGVR